ncbi:AcrR family transcriptional regulator [Scopulibacillus daqui]|uniref:AcrR family transcriptional regulator n=1 Tax=Scopulibacillus daqui TaxID=1469162 RepID=A0ABS2PVS9_9BACL|nr:TetR/AcrR family transcriptional regulator [Scopulibacillus daqui]MBM7644120.1 AcrR family transcriptional regulator [Scopulibacillus daqui]
MKDRIMHGYIEEIKDKGMKFTMDDLAGRLGISKRTLYQHFSSKVDILDAIIEQTFNDVDEQTKKIVEDDSLSLMDKIKGVITVVPNHVEFLDLRVLDQMKKYYPEQWRIVHAGLNDWDELRVLIEQGIQEGLIKDMNVDLIMKLLIDSTNATLDQTFFLKNNISVQEALSSIVDILLHGLAVENKS